MFKIFPQHREEDERRTASSASSITGDDCAEHSPLKVEVFGSYGIALGDKVKFTHVIALGTGTGFVPVLSALQDHTRQGLPCILVDMENTLKRHSYSPRHLKFVALRTNKAREVPAEC